MTHWRIQAGKAQTWVAPSRGYLCVAQGRAWVSCDVPNGPALDHVLLAGERLLLQAGQRAVLEPWARDAETDVALIWQPFSAAVPSKF